MKAIFFDKTKTRTQKDIDKATEELTLIQTNMNISYKIKYKLAMYDSKSRPVYIEVSRGEVETTLT